MHIYIEFVKIQYHKEEQLVLLHMLVRCCTRIVLVGSSLILVSVITFPQIPSAGYMCGMPKA